MTIYTTSAAPAADAASLTCEILVSYCDDADLDGDWRYSAFCPDVDAAMDGRTLAEALARVKAAIAIKLADCPAGQLPTMPPAARAAAVGDFLEDGRLVLRTTASIERA